jgi:pimeloyl-ACP methyl ester carboxylesterase
LDYVETHHPGKKIFWVGHSGGGLAIWMHLARFPNTQERLNGVVTLASQATEAAHSIANRAMIYCASVATKALGFVPGKWLRLGAMSHPLLTFGSGSFVFTRRFLSRQQHC